MARINNTIEQASADFDRNGCRAKLNHAQQLMTAEQMKSLPAIAATDGQGGRAIAHVKYFIDGFTWFGTEFAEGCFFGAIVNQGAGTIDLGYFSAFELMALRGRFGHKVERDIYFRPCSLAEAVRGQVGERCGYLPKWAQAPAEPAPVAPVAGGGELAPAPAPARKSSKPRRQRQPKPQAAPAADSLAAMFAPIDVY